MKNNKKLILAGIGAIVLIFLLFGTGGGNNERNSTPEVKEELILKAAQTEIKGDLHGC